MGLLQWFTESDSTYGLTFDNTAGIAGFEVRWYDDLSRPSVATPSGPTPPDIEFSPIDGPRGFVFTVSRTFPPFEAVPPGLDVDPLLDEYGRALAAANVENEYWAEFLQHHQYVWARYVRGDRSPLTGYWHSSAIGGFADFTQADPRGTGNYAPASSPDGAVLLQLDSNDFGGWGDGGIGHLFGNLKAVGGGDLSSVRYHWDCA